MQICFGFFSYVAFFLAPPAGNLHLPPHLPITSFVLYHFRGALALLRCFGIASVLLLRCFGVDSALLWCCFGVRSAFLWLRRCFSGERCNFGATLVQLRLNLGSTMCSAQPIPHGQLLRCSFV